MDRILRSTVAVVLCLSAAACRRHPGDHPAAKRVVSGTEIGGLSLYQRSILAGGVVTFEEYERAVMVSAACARDRGVLVDGPYLGPDRIYNLGYGAADPNDLGAAGLAFNQCATKYSSAVSDIWQTQRHR
jgi:hypothetical protein